MAFLKSFFDHTEHAFYFFFQLSFPSVHSRPQRQRFFWSAPRIATLVAKSNDVLVLNCFVNTID